MHIQRYSSNSWIGNKFPPLTGKPLTQETSSGCDSTAVRVRKRCFALKSRHLIKDIRFCGQKNRLLNAPCLIKNILWFKLLQTLECINGGF